MDDAKLNELTDDELTNLVATKVMGWTACWPENVGEEWWYDGDEPICNVEKWNPCNDWNDMKLVIGQFGREYQKHLVWHGHRNLVGEEKDWCFVIGLGTSNRWAAWDDKAGRAVCIAALKAKGVGL